jgi:2-iminobutanoate/2-iminopropanoate deaminase
MRRLLALALLLPIALSAQGSSRRGQPGQGFPAGAALPSTPQQVIAADVPVLEGIPHAVKIGYTVYVSAMVPLDSAGHLVGAGDFTAQTRQVVSNLGAVMRAARGVPGDVVRATVYLKNISADRVAAVRSAVLEGLDRSSPPALTIVGVTAFADPRFEVSIEATGQLRGEFPDRSRMGKP